MAVLFAYIHVSFTRESETWFSLLFTRKISRCFWWNFVSMFLYNMYEKVYRPLDYRPLAWKWRSHDNLFWCGFGRDFLHSPQGFTDFKNPLSLLNAKLLLHFVSEWGTLVQIWYCTTKVTIKRLYWLIGVLKWLGRIIQNLLIEANYNSVAAQIQLRKATYIFV